MLLKGEPFIRISSVFFRMKIEHFGVKTWNYLILYLVLSVLLVSLYCHLYSKDSYCTVHVLPLPDCPPAARRWQAGGFRWPRTGR